LTVTPDAESDEKRRDARASELGVAVRLEGVSKTYGAVRALAGVSVRISFGRVTVVEGPNGSGKSTLLGILGTLARATTGLVDHSAIAPTRAGVRRKLGWLGHETLCYPDLSGVENIRMAAQLHGCDVAATLARARERFDLGSFADRPVRTYSRGQRQRVALARALVHDPALLLLDEPTAGLDAASTESLSTVVRQEAERGAAVVVITHDEAFATRVGDRRYRLERGRVIP
jgi:heme exporter protein A